MPTYGGVALRRDGKGRWHYNGPACTFDATIHPDGQVGFRDRPSVGKPAVKGSPPLKIPGDSQARSFSGIVVGITIVFDVTDAVMRALKQDPYGAEKRRFASSTRAWRTRLRSQYLKRIRKRAFARFRPVGPICRRYRRLVAKARARYRGWLFARWDETREDAGGKRLRAAVLHAIKRCGIRYTPRELVRLNQRRQSRNRFAP